MNDLVSVIVPVYNVEKFLRKCVESIINQTYKNLEVILVDDGATDNSPLICEEFKLEDDRIKVIHKTNGGLSDARNAGLDVITGSYFMFLDSDDWIEPDCIEKAYTEVQKTGTDVVVWGYYADFVDQDENLKERSPRAVKNCIVTKRSNAEYLLSKNVLGHIGYAWNKLYRRDRFGQFRFEKGTSLVEDILYNSSVLVFADSVAFMSYIGTHYMQRETATLGTKKYKNYKVLKLRAVNARAAILKEYGVSKKKRHKFIVNSDAFVLSSDLRKAYRYVKNWLPERTKANLSIKLRKSNTSQWSIKCSSNSRHIFVFLAGFYQNLGDMAITYAQVKFLELLFPDADVVTISSHASYSAIATIRRFIKPHDIITVIGGGNTSDTYQSLEDCRLQVVRSFPKHRIILFPQTIEFNNKSSLQKSRRIYSAHKNLVMFAREPASFDRAKIYFPKVDIGLASDIVLSLNKFEPDTERHGILCCLRSDKEQQLRADFRERLIQAAKDRFTNVAVKDTVDVSLEDCAEERYEQTLESFWDLLRHQEVVITDRLHCMIFCVITGTPCVVMDNTNHKISGVYNAWLKDADYIRFIEKNELETVIQAAEEVRNIKAQQPTDLTEQFESLRKACMI